MSGGRLYTPAQLAVRSVPIVLTLAAVAVVAFDRPPPRHALPATTGASVSLAGSDPGAESLDGRSAGWLLWSAVRRDGDRSSF